MNPRVGCGGIEVGFLNGFISVKAAMTLQFVKVECTTAEGWGNFLSPIWCAALYFLNAKPCSSTALVSAAVAVQ